MLMPRFFYAITLIALSSLVVAHLKPNIEKSKASFYIYYFFRILIIITLFLAIGFELWRILPSIPLP